MSPCSSTWPEKGVGEGSAGAGAGAASSRDRRRASARSRASCAAETGPVASWFVSDGAGGGMLMRTSPSSSYLWGVRRRFSGDGVRRRIPGLFELNSLMALRFTLPKVDSWSRTRHARAACTGTRAPHSRRNCDSRDEKPTMKPGPSARGSARSPPWSAAWAGGAASLFLWAIWRSQRRLRE